MSKEIKNLTAKELMKLDGEILEELLTRKLVRTRNKPIGDLAEAAVAAALNAKLENNSKKGYDLQTADGKRVQVKALQLHSSRAHSSFQFSAFRQPFDFDTCIFVTFTPEADLASAIEVSRETIELIGKYTKHTNSYKIRLPQIQDFKSKEAIDLTLNVRACWDELR